VTEGIPSWVDAAPQGSTLDAPLKGEAGKRSPGAMREIIKQFDVTRSQRYAKGNRGGGSWCNRFVCDVTAALGCPIPYQLANDFTHWFKTKGVAAGWTPTLRADVRMRVEMGLPVVAHFWNPQGHGHIAMVVQPIDPSHIEQYKKNVLYCAQAGAKNSEEMAIFAAFGSNPVTFWSHV